MIREATIVDWPEVDRMAQAFRAAQPWASYDPEVFGRVFEGLVLGEGGCAMILDVGGAKGVFLAAAMPSPFSGEKLAQEVLWWIDPDVRTAARARAMLDAFEAWMGEVGAVNGGLVCLDDRTAKLFEKRGYTRTEIVYRVT